MKKIDKDPAFLKRYREATIDEIGVPPFDEILTQMIEDGTEKLTDDLFFRLLKESPSYLSTRPFIKKIAQWQYINGNPLFEDEDQKKAKDNLLKISKILAKKPKGRPEANLIFVYEKFIGLVEAIEKFSQERSLKPGELLPTLLSACPKYKEYLDLKGKRRPRKPRQMAIDIISRKYSVSPRIIETAIETEGGRKIDNKDNIES